MPAETHVERGPLDRRQVFELIRDRLADILEIEPDRISEGASFTDDLGADSLALIELVEAIEAECGVRDQPGWPVAPRTRQYRSASCSLAGCRLAHRPGAGA